MYTICRELISLYEEYEETESDNIDTSKERNCIFFEIFGVFFTRIMSLIENKSKYSHESVGKQKSYDILEWYALQDEYKEHNNSYYQSDSTKE